MTPTAPGYVTASPAAVKAVTRAHTQAEELLNTVHVQLQPELAGDKRYDQIVHQAARVKDEVLTLSNQLRVLRVECEGEVTGRRG